MKQWFSKGYGSVQEYSEELDRRQEEAKSRSKFIPNAMLKDGESAMLRFLTAEPITFFEHYLKDAKGRKYYTCLQGITDEKTGEPVECPFCGMGNKPSFRGAYAVIDRRTDTWKDKENVEHSEANQVKLFKQGIKCLKVLDKLSSKRDILAMDVEITRTGTSTDTQYNFIPDDKKPLSAEDKKKVEEFCGEKTIEDILVAELSPISVEAAMRVIGGGYAGTSTQSDSGASTGAAGVGQPTTYDDEDTIGFK